MPASAPQDVDDIWAEMQREQQGTKAKVATTKAFDLSALQRERTKPAAKRPVKTLDASMQWMEKWAAPLKMQTEVGFPAHGPGVSPSEVDEAVRMTEPPTTLVDAFADEMPTGTPETFLAYLQRDINCLGEDGLAVRLQSLQKLERVLVARVDGLATDLVDRVAEAVLKPLLKRMKDKSEKCRELSARILRSLVENASDLAAMLPYVFPTLVSRLGCEDLDGVAHLPEVMRPDPEQRPTELSRPVEESEEVRLELARFVASLLERCTPTQVYSYIDEATGLLRAEAMDPFHEVKAMACDTMISFCHNHTEMLLHFSEPMGRSLTSCLLHNHAKIRIAALRALTAVLWCGVWKHNFEILQLLMAWQDPNKVPIKAFYEATTKVNYMSTLSFDRHPAVRRFWFETLAYWLLRVPDKVDHEPYIFPYLLSGLCDENEEIALEVFWLIERCGELYETEKEEDLRKTKQYGFDYGWTYSGKGFIPFPLQATWAGGREVQHFRRIAAQGPDFMGEKDLGDHSIRDSVSSRACADRPPREDLGDEVTVPARDYAWPELRELGVFRTLPRPRLGSRCWVRTHTRRYIKATFNDVVDFRDCTALNAGRLLCMSIAYTEEGVTEWLQPMVAALVKFYSGRAWAAGDQQVMKTFDTVCKLLGAYLDPASYWEQLKDALSPDSASELDQRVASTRILSLCLEGSIAVLQSVDPPDPNLGMGRLAPVVPELVAAMHSSDLLLSPTAESRAALWGLLFSFSEPLRSHLSFAEVSQLLFVSLALAAKSPGDPAAELAGASAPVEAPRLGEEELLDAEHLERALACLGADLDGAASAGDGRAEGPASEAPAKAAGFDLDALDDDGGGGGGLEEAEASKASSPQPAPLPKADELRADPRAAHMGLFSRAFPEVLAHVDDCFQVFRSVVYLTPLSVLTASEHGPPVVEKLAFFCGGSSSSSTRMASHALGVHLALRCAKLLGGCFGAGTGAAFGEAGERARALIWKLFATMGQAQLETAKKSKTLSYMSVVSGLSIWRRFFLSAEVDPRLALFGAPGAAKGSEPSPPMEWLCGLMADQELYKRFHAALEHAETSTTGRDKDGFVVRKTKQIREEADHRANVVRLFAASTLLLALRRMLGDGRGAIPWRRSSAASGSASAMFSTAASLFRTATPTMDPPFVKPTPSSLTLYASETLRLLLHLPEAGAPAPALEPYRLLDDAARAIHDLRAPPSAPRLPIAADADEREALASDFIGTLIDLNLTLPPDPNAKHAPASLDEAGGGDIVLGWDAQLEDPSISFSSPAPSQAVPSSSAVPSEVLRVLAQSGECLSWNCAHALYVLGLDLSVVCQDGFQQSMARWRRKREQARILLTLDVLERSKRVLGEASQ